jgi:pimeloyl-ACP methyl ester carboxylesterase
MEQARVDTANLSQLERVLGKAFKEANPAAAVLYQQLNSFNATDKSNLTGVYATEKVAPAQLASLGMPIMFISGQDDILFPLAAVRLVQEQLAGSFMVEFDNCGHSAFFERAEEFNDSVLSFLQMAGLNPLNNSAHSNACGYEKAL